MAEKSNGKLSKGIVVKTPKPISIEVKRAIRSGERPAYQAPPVPPKKS